MSGDVFVNRFPIRTAYLVAAIGAGTILPPNAAAQEPGQPVRSVTLDEALGLFAEQNLELRLARSRVDQAVGLARQAGAFPNPYLNATHEPLSGDSRSYSETYLTASQRLELSGARGARSAAGTERGRAAFAQLRADSLRIAFDVKRTFVEALLAQEQQAFTRRITEIFRDAARSATERYEAGDASLYALRRIRVERARYETLLVDADLQVGSAQRALALLVAPSDDAARLAAEPLSAPTPPDVDPGVLYGRSIEDRPELTAARAETEAESAQARLARAERIPDVTATAGWKRQSDGLRGAFLGLSVPLPLFDRGGGAVEAADAGLRTAEESLALTRRQLENDRLRARDSYESLRRRAALLPEPDTGGAGDLLDIALVAYGEGEMELVELLDASDAMRQALTAEAELRASLWITYFDLERALGGFAAAPAQEDQP
jgi:cobalt-zinc-cadmium efflux system outer membrane protein